MSNPNPTVDRGLSEANEALRKGDTASALLILQATALHFPKDTRLHKALVDLLRATGRPLDALKVGVSWYKAHPDSDVCLDTLAGVAEELGRTTEANKWRAQAVELRRQRDEGAFDDPAPPRAPAAAPVDRDPSGGLPSALDAFPNAPVRPAVPKRPAQQRTQPEQRAPQRPRVTPPPEEPPQRAAPPPKSAPPETAYADEEPEPEPYRPPPEDPPFSSFDRYTAATGITSPASSSLFPSSPRTTTESMVATVVAHCASNADLERLVSFAETFARTWKSPEFRLALVLAEPREALYVDRLRARLAPLITGMSPRVSIALA